MNTKRYFKILLFICYSCSVGAATQMNMDVLPKSVLLGNDVKSVSEFKPVNMSDISGSYYAEQGGADLTLGISSAGKAYTIIRVFQEPGMTKDEKQYVINNYSDGRIIEINLYAIFVNNGVLLLEINAESFGVPADMWIFYHKK